MGRKLAAGFIALTAFWVFLGARASLDKMARGSLEEARELPEFAMSRVTPEGTAPLGKEQLLGRPWIANFIFTRCMGPCPVMSKDMAGLQAKLPKEVRLVSFTVDPDYDKPAVLREYGERFGADPARWYFARGTGRELYKLMYEGFGLALARDDDAPEGYRVTHSTRFVLVDGAGRVRGYYARGASKSLGRLKQDALKLLEEKS